MTTEISIEPTITVDQVAQQTNQDTSTQTTSLISPVPTNKSNNTLLPPSPVPSQTRLERRRSLVEQEEAMTEKLSDAKQEQVNEKALAIIHRVESKLKGTDFSDANYTHGKLNLHHHNQHSNVA